MGVHLTAPIFYSPRKVYGSEVKAEPIPIATLSSLDTFDTPQGFVLFFKGRATPELIDFHSRFDSLLEKFAKELGKYYRPGRWTPHCTLAWGLSSDPLLEAKEICQSYILPIVGHFVRVAIVEVPCREKSLECSFATRDG